MPWRSFAENNAQIKGIYEAAIREINARLHRRWTAGLLQYMHNPIHHMESRVKTLGSIVRKLHSLGYPISISCAKKTLHDIAGVRVVCRYVDDIYRIADLLLAQDDISLILEKNYIKNPKPNGYRSLHIVVDVPVYVSQGKLFIPVEIQIRTVAMDFCASSYSWGPAATRALPASLLSYLTKFLMKRPARSLAFSSQTAGSA